MLIFEIASFLHPSYELLDDFGVVVKNVSPSRFSFLTSMRIATACKQQQPDVIFTHDVKNSIAAISSRKISNTKDSGRHVPIVLYVHNGTALPHSIPTDVVEGLDAIVFETLDEQQRWTKVRNIELLKNTTVIPYPGPSSELPKKTSKEKSSKPKLGYVGPIDKGKTLAEMLEKIASLESEKQPEIIVAGTTKARYIMPVVKRARANKLDVKWLGDEYIEDDVLSEIEGFIPSSSALSMTEKRLLANGIPEVFSEKLHDWLDVEKREKMAGEAVTKYDESYTPNLFVERFRTLVGNIK